MSHDIQYLSFSVFLLGALARRKAICVFSLYLMIMKVIISTNQYIPHLSLFSYNYIHSFIHSIGMRRMQQFLAFLRSFFHSSLLCTFSCHPSPPTILPSSLTSSCHLFLGLPLNLVVPKFIYNTLLGILFPSILCTCPNQHNLFNLIVSSHFISKFPKL